MDLVNKSLNSLGLEISPTKTQLFDYNLTNKIKFDLFGFTFLYVPYSKIAQGGIIKRSDIVHNKQLRIHKISNTGGTHLIYPSTKSFAKIKELVKNSIKELKHRPVFEVILKVNSIIRGWVNYFAWSLASRRLSQLEHFVFKLFKKSLINKFRKRGIYRINWVMKEFFLCNTDANTKSLKSPYKRRWHLHAKYPTTQNNKKRFKDVIWLLLPTKMYRIVPISDNALSPKVRIVPYYIIPEEYNKNQVKLVDKRIINSDYKKKLYLLQKGICPHCHLSLDLNQFNNIETSFWLIEDQLEIHHIKPIAVGNTLSSTEHQFFNKIDNLVLLHKECHYEITYSNQFTI